MSVLTIKIPLKKKYSDAEMNTLSQSIFDAIIYAHEEGVGEAFRDAQGKKIYYPMENLSATWRN